MQTLVTHNNNSFHAVPTITINFATALTMIADIVCIPKPDKDYTNTEDVVQPTNIAVPTQYH